MAAQSMGPHVVVLLAFVCVAGPPIACAVLLWRLDPSKRDLINHTVVPLALGASVPPLVTRIAQAVFGLPGSVFPPFLQSYAPVPLSVWTGLIEEAAKAVVVLAVFAWMRRGFVDALDGLVLGGIVGAGMALAQGLVYVEDLAPVAQIARITPGTLLTTGAVGLTQCAFTAVFGASLGYAREAPRRGFIPIIGFAAAALYHMAYVALGTLAGAPQLGTAAGAAGIAREVADWIGVMFVAAAAWWARSGPRAARDPAGLGRTGARSSRVAAVSCSASAPVRRCAPRAWWRSSWPGSRSVWPPRRPGGRAPSGSRSSSRSWARTIVRFKRPTRSHPATSWGRSSRRPQCRRPSGFRRSGCELRATTRSRSRNRI